MPVIFGSIYCHWSIIVHGWTSFSMITRCVVLLTGDWAIFYHAGSGRVDRVWSARGKSLKILRHVRELKPGDGEDRQWDHRSRRNPPTPMSEIHTFSHWAWPTMLINCAELSFPLYHMFTTTVRNSELSIAVAPPMLWHGGGGEGGKTLSNHGQPMAEK